MNRLIDIIRSEDPAVRNLPLDAQCDPMTDAELRSACAALDDFWRASENLYERVRGLFFLSAIHRFHWPRRLAKTNSGVLPYKACEHLLQRRFLEAIDAFLSHQQEHGLSDAIASGLALGYREMAFQTLANQVRRSVRSVSGNQWMFRLGHPSDHPLRLRRELVPAEFSSQPVPVLRETTAVRMDFSHSGWSDIFFLGMDYPEGARVLNASIDLAVRGRDAAPRPPIETYLRVIDRPLLKLVSIDLGCQAEITALPEVFDFARDYLGLLKAAVIASGLVPPGMEGCEQPISSVLDKLVGPGLGLEIVSRVHDIPKGSRLAVSTNLLGSLIALCMRATGQVSLLTGELTESDRRIVAARAILGEWLGGSGGGWQDSGGLWPGVKLICGETAQAEDPEYGISRGRLLPKHLILDASDMSAATRKTLQKSLVLVHGGMAQNVGPILEMVTEKYLLRSEEEWQARQTAGRLLDDIMQSLATGDIRSVGAATMRNFSDPLQTIIPWCNNLFTQSLIEQTRQRFGENFWGFWMLGGMAGGGMGFLFDPRHQVQAKDWMQQALIETKAALEDSLPFAMEPVVYDFRINERGTVAELIKDRILPMPHVYYEMMLPNWLRTAARELSPQVRKELENLSHGIAHHQLADEEQRSLFSRLLPQPAKQITTDLSLQEFLERYGFDRQQHESIRSDLRSGRIGLAQNRLPSNTQILDVRDEDLREARDGVASRFQELGQRALAAGQVAVVTLAAGAGSRWTEGAGVVKALHPFCRMEGAYRRFVDVHLAKTRQSSRQFQVPIPHVFTTGYLTESPIAAYLASLDRQKGAGPVSLSPGRSVGLRFVPMVRDLVFAWEELPQQLLDEQQEKVRSSLRQALMNWARSMGEGSDYTDNVPLQCLHPVGHWYEIPNMLRNGVLKQLLDQQPELKYLFVHNIDTLGAHLDPGLLGLHIDKASTLTFEVISRRIEDRGGGLARVDGTVRLVEGLALPREEDEFQLRYYNTLSNWISIDPLLSLFGLSRESLGDTQMVDKAVRALAQRLPTYITIKDVKKRWGHGQEDIYPVAQFEKLWGDMTALAEVNCQFVAVPMFRGQQLKEQSQLDGWLRDGSAEFVNRLCDWS